MRSNKPDPMSSKHPLQPPWWRNHLAFKRNKVAKWPNDVGLVGLRCESWVVVCDFVKLVPLLNLVVSALPWLSDLVKELKWLNLVR